MDKAGWLYLVEPEAGRSLESQVNSRMLGEACFPRGPQPLPALPRLRPTGSLDLPLPLEGALGSGWQGHWGRVGEPQGGRKGTLGGQLSAQVRAAGGWRGESQDPRA